MKNLCSALGLALGLLLAVPVQAWAQKIIVVTGASGVKSDAAETLVRVIRFGRVAHRHFSTLGAPDQTLFPRYYRFPQPYAQGPDMKSRIRGGKTARQGSLWRGHIKGGRTVEQGASTRSHIKGGRTIEGGSRWASHIKAGATVEQGSPFASTIPNWRFSGYAAPMRPKGIPYYRARRTRSPWGSQLR